jgi:hypothetical protein
MRDPKRLLEGDPGDLSVKLIRAWRSQQPPSRARSRTAAALGLGASVAVSKAVGATTAGGTALAGAQGLSTASALGGTASTAAVVTRIIVVKWLAGGLLAGSVAAVTVDQVMRAESPAAPAVSSSVAPRLERSADASGGTRPEGSARTLPLAGDAPDVAGVAPGSTPAARTTSARAGDVAGSTPHGALADQGAEGEATPAEAAAECGSLPQEVAAVEQARRAVAARDPGRALRALERYRALKPSAALEPEARLLQIEALELAGQRPQAAQLAQRFIAEYPKSPHAAGLRRLVAESRQAAESPTR